MKKSRVIALSSLSAALMVILLTVGAYYPTFDISCLFLASVVTMIPLSKNSYLGATLAVLASALLTLFVSGFRFQIVLPFVLFFGFHPMVNMFFSRRKVNKWIVFAIKDVWFVLTLVMLQVMSGLIVVDIESIQHLVYPIIILGGAIAFFAYDFFMKRFQMSIDLIIKRLKL